MKRAVVLLLLWQALIALPLLAEEPATAPTERLTRIAELRHAAQESSAQPDSQQQVLTQLRSEKQEVSLSAIKMIQALGLCIGVFLIATFLVRKYGPKNLMPTGRRLRVREKLPVTSKTSLMLIEVDERPFLVAVGPDHVAFCDHEIEPRFDQEATERALKLVCQEDEKLSVSGY
ncbi:MAG: flagellar biosynthetic protein FliO [Oligoflexia bacterium]|nr:flagellar biosynthetic protein FliO [Oligoflexia bacterium]